MDIQEGIRLAAIGAIPVIFAITVHEAAHGYAARYFGDDTAERAGRISLNPIHHIDPLGTIILPAITMILGGILFGWAKPVPVNFGRLRHPKRDMLWVAAAGPLSNFVMAIFWVLVLKFSDLVPASYSEAVITMSQIGMSINIVLMVLNLLPLPPLDGGRIATSLLPNNIAWKFAQVERYGFLILLLLLATGVLSVILLPMVIGVQQLLLTIFG
jgi:Zn-dependent protease